jgi:malonyl-CoA O-methyltransferase
MKSNCSFKNSSETAISSDKVERNFSKAALSYERAALVQRLAAAELLEFFYGNIPHGFVPSRILELGCGTGFITDQILSAYPNAEFLAADISDDMLRICRNKIFLKNSPPKNSRIEFEILDFNTDFNFGEFDLIISGLSFQWADDIQALIGRTYSNLVDGGLLCFSTLGKGSFRELRKKFSSAGEKYPIPEYPDICEFRRFAAKFSSFISEEKPRAVRHLSLVDFLRSLKNTGAVNPAVDMIRLSKLRKIMSEASDTPFECFYNIYNILCVK